MRNKFNLIILLLLFLIIFPKGVKGETLSAESKNFEMEFNYRFYKNYKIVDIAGVADNTVTFTTYKYTIKHNSTTISDAICLIPGRRVPPSVSYSLNKIEGLDRAFGYIYAKYNTNISHKTMAYRILYSAINGGEISSSDSMTLYAATQQRFINVIAKFVIDNYEKKDKALKKNYIDAEENTSTSFSKTNILEYVLNAYRIYKLGSNNDYIKCDTCDNYSSQYYNVDNDEYQDFLSLTENPSKKSCADGTATGEYKVSDYKTAVEAGKGETYLKNCPPTSCDDLRNMGTNYNKWGDTLKTYYKNNCLCSTKNTTKTFNTSEYDKVTKINKVVINELQKEYKNQCPPSCTIGPINNLNCKNSGSGCNSRNSRGFTFSSENGLTFKECLENDWFDEKSKKNLYTDGKTSCYESEVKTNFIATSNITALDSTYSINTLINSTLVCVNNNGTTDGIKNFVENYKQKYLKKVTVNISSNNKKASGLSDNLEMVSSTTIMENFSKLVDSSIDYKDETEATCNKIKKIYDSYINKSNNDIVNKMNSYFNTFDLNNDKVIDQKDKDLFDSITSIKNNNNEYTSSIYFVPKLLTTSSNTGSVQNLQYKYIITDENGISSYMRYNMGYRFSSKLYFDLDNKKSIADYSLNVDYSKLKVGNDSFSNCATSCDDNVSLTNGRGYCYFTDTDGDLKKKYFTNNQDNPLCNYDYILGDENNEKQISTRVKECSESICNCPTCNGNDGCVTETGEKRNYDDYPDKKNYCSSIYGINSTEYTNCLEDNVCPCTNCVKSTGNYFFRNISLNDVFPNSKYDVSGKSLIKFRAIGINWRTTKGKDTQKEIEEAGDKIYNNNNESSTTNNTNYYSFDLTPSSMRKIREYNKKNDYSDFNMTCSIYGTNINIKKCYSNFISDFLNPSKGYIKSSSYDLTELEKARKTFAQYADGSAWK